MAQTATMPVTTPTPVGRSADPCVMVIFGASGDLTQRKLIPALYNLARVQLLSPNFAVVGVARRPMSSEEYRRKLSEEVREFVTGDFDAELWDAFVRRMHYLAGNFDNKDTYENLKQLLGKIDQESSTRGNYFYYLATAPDAFGEIVESLAGAGSLSKSPSATTWKAPVSSIANCSRLPKSSRFTASIITWGKKPFRTSWRFASRTESLNPSGTAATSTTFRSRWPRLLASKSAGATTTRPAPCATWCPTTSCSSSR